MAQSAKVKPLRSALIGRAVDSASQTRTHTETDRERERERERET